ncbi:MAG: hypothetical protein J5930_04155 [Treponema sp.]|nr:hypothetical protein [Treponema sp.]
MDSIQKLYSDAEKIKKHERADHPSDYSGLRVCSRLGECFVRSHPGVESLASSFVDYWIHTYIDVSESINEEPVTENIDKLAAMSSVLDGSSEFTECLTTEDWKELCSLTTFEAEDVDIDALNGLMSLFVEKQAL